MCPAQFSRRPSSSKALPSSSQKLKTAQSKDPGMDPEQMLRMLLSMHRGPSQLAKSLGLTPAFIGQVVRRRRRSDRVESAITEILSPLGCTREALWGPIKAPGQPRCDTVVPTAPVHIGPQLAKYGLELAIGRRIPARHLVGLVVDCETTGLNANRHALLEAAAVAFVYHWDMEGRARVLGVLGQYSGLQDPGSAEIDPISMRVNRINLKAVTGQRLDLEALRTVSDMASVVIAHNVSFDRPFLLKHAPWLETLPWHCSMRGVNWKALGFDKKSLKTLCEGFGLPTPDHRALTDVLATLRLLDTEVVSGQSLLGLLLKKEPG